MFTGSEAPLNLPDPHTLHTYVYRHHKHSFVINLHMQLYTYTMYMYTRAERGSLTTNLRQVAAGLKSRLRGVS